MKLFNVVLVMMLVAVTGIKAQPASNSVIGKWESDEKDVRMEFFKEGDQLRARLLWGNKIVEADGRTSKKDEKNPDKNMRSRNIIGIISVTELKWNGKEYTGGRIYDPPSGKTYDCKVWFEKDKLYLRGFMGVSMLGKTVPWHRYNGLD